MILHLVMLLVLQRMSLPVNLMCTHLALWRIWQRYDTYVGPWRSMFTSGEQSMCDTMLCVCLLRLLFCYCMPTCFALLFRLLICDVGLRHLTVVRLILCLLTVLGYVTNVPVTSLCDFTVTFAYLTTQELYVTFACLIHHSSHRFRTQSLVTPVSYTHLTLPTILRV